MNHMKIQKLFLYVIYLLILDYNKCDFKDMFCIKWKINLFTRYMYGTNLSKDNSSFQE